MASLNQLIQIVFGFGSCETPFAIDNFRISFPNCHFIQQALRSSVISNENPEIPRQPADESETA